MIRPTKVTALSGHRIEVAYPDDVKGIIDLSGSVGRGIFAPLADETLFKSVYIGEFGQIAWSEEIEICPDSAYLEITGKHSPELTHA